MSDLREVLLKLREADAAVSVAANSIRSVISVKVGRLLRAEDLDYEAAATFACTVIALVKKLEAPGE